jgi:hypothetical protein
MTPPHVLTFTANGEGHGLYTEAIELSAIGRLTIRRATTIEFNETSQQWEVRDAGGALLHTHPSRGACLAWEHRHFNS